MLEIDGNTRQILLTDKEDVNIQTELIKAFCALDNETELAYYSGERIEKRYPLLWKLYNILSTISK